MCGLKRDEGVLGCYGDDGSGTPNRLVLTSTESVWEVHEHRQEPHDEKAHAAADEKREVTMALIKYKTPLAAVSFPRLVNATTAMQAAAPAVEVSRLLRMVGVGSDVLRGFGAVQVNLRYDFLDLNSRGIIGGTQNGLQASLIWIPTDYVRLLLNYGRMQYDDAAIPAAGGDRDYAVDVIGARAQIDF